MMLLGAVLLHVAGAESHLDTAGETYYVFLEVYGMSAPGGSVWSEGRTVPERSPCGWGTDAGCARKPHRGAPRDPPAPHADFAHSQEEEDEMVQMALALSLSDYPKLREDRGKAPESGAIQPRVRRASLLEAEAGLDVWHSHVVLCPTRRFPPEERIFLESELNTKNKNSKNIMAAGGRYNSFEYDQARWTADGVKDIPCRVLTFGGDSCTTANCGQLAVDMKLGEMINWGKQTYATKAYKYFYGTFSHSADELKEAMQCHNLWRGTDYRIVTKNCNHHSSYLLECWMGRIEDSHGRSVSKLGYRPACPSAEACPMRVGPDVPGAHFVDGSGFAPEGHQIWF